MNVERGELSRQSKNSGIVDWAPEGLEAVDAFGSKEVVAFGQVSTFQTI